MTREEALNLLYSAFSPEELAEWVNKEIGYNAGPFDSNLARSLMLRIAIELSEDIPTENLYERDRGAEKYESDDDLPHPIPDDVIPGDYILP